jgi:hypothetical protein
MEKQNDRQRQTVGQTVCVSRRYLLFLIEIEDEKQSKRLSETEVETGTEIGGEGETEIIVSVLQPHKPHSFIPCSPGRTRMPGAAGAGPRQRKGRGGWGFGNRGWGGLGCRSSSMEGRAEMKRQIALVC